MIDAAPSRAPSVRGAQGRAARLPVIQRLYNPAPRGGIARRMGGANGSRECAPDDELRDTHQLLFVALMGFAKAQPILTYLRRVERAQPHGIEWRQVGGNSFPVRNQLGERLAGRRRVEDAPDVVAGGHIGALA